MGNTTHLRANEILARIARLRHSNRINFLALESRTVRLLACFALFLSAVGQPVWAQPVCHDGNWNNGEFCGRDAWLVTGDTEMNHDCSVDLLDVVLFLPDFIVGFGSNLSGDFNGNGAVDALDFASYFIPSYGNSVSPCTPSGMLRDGCQGSLALSFSSDPNAIVSTLTGQSPGPGTLYVVVSGWVNPVVIDYAVEASSNITILSHPVTPNPHWAMTDPTVNCDPDSQHSYRGSIKFGGSWPTGPAIWTSLNYSLSDTNPAWLKLTPVPACKGNSRIRWAKAGNRTIDFATLLNVGINGPAPPGQPTCSAAPVPTLNQHAFWPLPVGLLVIAVLVLESRRAARTRQ